MRIIKASFQKDAEVKIIKYFQELTGKKYVLITNSCRTALYLAYKSIGIPGEVLTSPLTCKTAIDPIEESDYRQTYCDIKLDDLTLDPDDLATRITKNTRAIQVIHFGGVACEMDRICELAKQHNLFIIEDCAQALGARYKNLNCGSFGDVACFSLIKNGYGIGGGIFVTHDHMLFEKASTINNQFQESPKSLLLFRLLRNYLESYRRFALINYFYTFMMKKRNMRISYKNYKTVVSQLSKASKLEINLFAAILKSMARLHKNRQLLGSQLYKVMKNNDMMLNTIYNESDCSFTKYIAYHPRFQVPLIIEQLNNLGIEAKHLEQKYMTYYQKKLIYEHPGIPNSELKNYFLVHDHLISLPLCEYFTDKEINRIVFLLKTIVESCHKN